MHRLGQYLVSPIGKDGFVYFIAFDVDSNNVNDVKAILKIIPEPSFVSFSGLKGWHIWIFPSQPLEVDTSVAFAKIIKARSRVNCEIFPNSRKSKCLKWIQSEHPTTRVIESFVDKVSFNSNGVNTEVILKEISSGMHRVPSEQIISFVKENKVHYAKKPVVKKASGIASDPEINIWFSKIM